MTLYLAIGRPDGALMVRTRSRVRAPSSALEFCTKTSPQFGTIFVRVCPRLSIRRGWQNHSTGAKNDALPSDRASRRLSHGKAEVSGSIPDVGLALEGLRWRED